MEVDYITREKFNHG
ncbi:Protein of unknown function [Bacillus wiedmannii]|nr:Protein of unknown function [Bacillus wiedmannii]